MTNSNNRSISGSFNGGATFGHNTNIQSDHNVNTVTTGETGLPADVFEQLKKEILETLKDETDQEQALEFAESLEGAVASQDKEKASKYGKWLDRLIQGSSALGTIMTAVQGFQQ